MTHSTELWLTYHQASRSHKPATAQLIELTDAQKLHDLEDVIDHVFQQGFVDPKWRSVSWWEQCDGVRIKASHGLQDLLAMGAGHSPETALRLVIADIPSAVWMKYVYLHSARGQVATQRIRLDALHLKFDRLAHITNHVFAQGYLPPKLRTLVYWEGICGKQLDENAKVEEIISWGEGVSEEKALRLVIASAISTVYQTVTMSSLGNKDNIDLLFLEQCIETAKQPAIPGNRSPVSATSTLGSARLRLTGHYADAFTDTYGTVSGAPFVYKTGQPWPKRVGGREAQPFIRETRPVHGHAITPFWPKFLKETEAYLNSCLRVKFTAITGFGFANAGEMVAFCPLLVNWAVIKLKEDAFDWNDFKGNQVYIAHRGQDQGGRLSSLMYPNSSDRAGYKHPPNDILQIYGSVPEDEIRNPKQLNAHGDKVMPVIKNGLTTGTTVGWVNGLKSLVRYYDNYNLDFTALETTILPYGGRGAFSNKGDSGAIILDRGGRIVALLTGGGGLTDETDVTFGTAWYELEPHIQKTLPGCHVYSAVNSGRFVHFF